MTHYLNYIYNKEGLKNMLKHIIKKNEQTGIHIINVVVETDYSEISNICMAVKNGGNTSPLNLAILRNSFSMDVSKTLIINRPFAFNTTEIDLYIDEEKILINSSFNFTIEYEYIKKAATS